MDDWQMRIEIESDLVIILICLYNVQNFLGLDTCDYLI